MEKGAIHSIRFSAEEGGCRMIIMKGTDYNLFHIIV